jgi:prepilin-type N-terminal cleavage/methylation domain-containing protein/prepilin-type processing-associated H-X9-DG protein
MGGYPQNSRIPGGGGRETRPRRGFTLIELLVVIAVIALLAAIVFPVFAQVREKGRQTTCLSNCRQIGMAQMLYLQDYDETLLPAQMATDQPRQPNSADPFLRWANWRTWTQLIEPYLKDTRVLYCPSFNEQVLVDNAAHPSCDGESVRRYFPARFYYSHFGMAFGAIIGECTPQRPRVALAGNSVGYAPWKTLAMVVRPAEAALFQDNFTAESAGDLGFHTAFGCECGTKGTRQKEGLGRSRHHQGCNYVFVDGHAKTMILDPEYEPQIPCPGATISGRTYPDCVCARYATYDY